VSAAKQFQVRRYTYDDYVTWSDDTRWELIDGIPYAMAAPTSRHQRISRNLVGLFYNFLKGKPCELFHAPYDVRLNYTAGDDTIVQPDLVVICDPKKISDKGCLGAPDLIIEILSLSTAGIDRVKKFNKYMKAGVREYWIVDPDTKSVQIFLLENGAYIGHGYFIDPDTISVSTLPECEISLMEVFSEV